ncbi:hypothetical protein [Anaerobacillus arseniciselenatis]|uniref:hypothetical protein n=1 Tax=Anaerobacillus arseniciselenatis TaxID=85682 RepID=UPI0014723BA6|nr:hypothetical protein [Anaerobacillus arseniciselenatis]
MFISDCNCEKHQYKDAKIRDRKDIVEYETEIEGLGIVQTPNYYRPITRRSFVKRVVIGMGMLAGSGVLTTLSGCFSSSSTSDNSDNVFLWKA